MGWEKTQDLVGEAAPMLARLLGGDASGTAGALAASALGVEAEPEEVRRVLEANPDRVQDLRDLESENQQRLRQLLLEAETQRLFATNAEVRARLASGDRFKGYWRPLFGYIVAFTWGLIMVAVAVIMVREPAEGVEKVLNGLEDLSVMWAVALAILGINVAKRSQDKALAFGKEAEGMLSGVEKWLRGGK